MTRTAKEAAPEPVAPPPADDPVLAGLHETEAAYRARYAELDRAQAELSTAQAEVARLRKEHTRLEHRLTAGEKRLAKVQEQADRQKARGDQFLDHLRDIHRALFSGDIYELILKACLTLTGATRGMYVTPMVPGTALRVRAMVGMEKHPGGPPSPFIQALYHKVLDDQETLVCNKSADLEGLPRPDRESEQFRNCLVAPVMLLHHFDGVIIAADKLRGEFDADDVASLLTIGDNAGVALENLRLQREVQRAYLTTVEMLADTMEAKDPYTDGHCRLVSHYARLTATHLGLDENERRIVAYAALLHDIGKIGVSDGVLNKPGPLLPEEWNLMRAHVRVGHDLVAKVPALGAVSKAVLHHHESFDGNGYPDGLRGEEIPMAARIVSVIDAYCAMTTKRSYKEASSPSAARKELERCAGTQFDPAVVTAFLAVLDSPEAGDFNVADDSPFALLPGITTFAHPAGGPPAPA